MIISVQGSFRKCTHLVEWHSAVIMRWRNTITQSLKIGRIEDIIESIESSSCIRDEK